MRNKVKTVLIFFILLMSSISMQAATISGFITDERNGESVPDAMVAVVGTTLGAYTNNKGYFIINSVPKGDIQIAFFNGVYERKIIEKTISNDTEEVFLNVELEQKIIEAEVIDVVGEEYGVNTRDIKIATVHYKTKDIQAVSQIAEADVFRSLQALPGVAPISDFSSGLYVRGGSPDQNLILIDGIDVYQPTHFGGVFSTFNADAVKKVELQKGGFPAKWGGRLSSVLDVTNKDGNRKDFQGILRTSLLSTSATLETPWSIGGEKGSIMGSFRRTYLDLISKAADLDLPDYYFYDGHAKVNWDINKRNKFSASSYFGKDELKMDFNDSDMHITWGNETLSTQWTHIFNPQLFSHFIVAGSRFYSLFDFTAGSGENTMRFKRDNKIKDVSVKGVLTYKPVEEHIIDFGFDTKYNNMIFKATTNGNEDKDRLPDVEVNSYTGSLYLQDNWNPTALWTFEPGVRMTFQHSQSDYLPGKPSKDRLRLAPRLAIRYKTTVNSNVYFSYGKYYQFLTLVTDSNSGGSPMDLWFPLDKTVDPGESDHYILGYKTELPGEMDFETEVYYKSYENINTLNPDADSEWNNETGTLSDILIQGVGRSYGADFLLRTNWMGFEGFLGYTFCMTERKIDSFNTNPEENWEEEYYFPKWDRNNQLNVVQTYKLTEQLGHQIWGADWTIGMTYSAGSGQPYSRPERIFYENGRVKKLMSYYDSYRLPMYSRFDLSIKMKWQYETWSIEPYVQAINLFNKSNVHQRAVNFDLDENDRIINIKEEDQEQFPRVPFIGVNIEF